MDKIITKCGVCGTKVATAHDDNDPVCVECLEWYLDMETRHKIQLLTQKLAFCLKEVQDTSDQLKNVKNYLFSPDQFDKINQLANLGLVTRKSLEYIDTFKGGKSWDGQEAIIGKNLRMYEKILNAHGPRAKIGSLPKSPPRHTADAFGASSKTKKPPSERLSFI